MRYRLVFPALLITLVGLAMAACSGPEPTATPTPTPTPDMTAEQAGAFIRAVVAQDPNCEGVTLSGARFTPTWNPDTLTWRVEASTTDGMDAVYILYEQRGLTVEVVEQFIPGVC